MQSQSKHIISLLASTYQYLNVYIYSAVRQYNKYVVVLAVGYCANVIIVMSLLPFRLAILPRFIYRSTSVHRSVKEHTTVCLGSSHGSIWLCTRLLCVK